MPSIYFLMKERQYLCQGRGEGSLLQVELGHALQGDGEEDSEAAQVHPCRLEHLRVAGLGALENGPVGRQEGQRHHLAVGDEPRFRTPRLCVKPSLPCLSLEVRPGISYSQKTAIIWSQGTFPAGSPVTA